MAAKKGRREQQKVGKSNEEVKAEPKTSEQKDDKHRSDVIKTLLPLSLGSAAGVTTYYATMGGRETRLE